MLALLAVAPFTCTALGQASTVCHGSIEASERLGPLLALMYLVSSIGLWAGMGQRAFLVGGVAVLALYALTAWTRLAFSLHDLYVLALLVGFLVYALAGFYLVFVLEEMVYDAHRLLQPRGTSWALTPFLVVTAVAGGLPPLRTATGVAMPALWTASLVAFAVLGSYWFVRIFNRLPDGPVLRELHLFVIGGLAAALIIDLVGLVPQGAPLLPSALAYLVLVGTWVYVTYTTLQRTHFLLRGRNAQPWFAILLGASFAVLSHVQLQFRIGRTDAFTPLLDQRLAWLVAGLWIGLSFFAARSLWRLFRHLRDDRRLGARIRIAAGRLARVAEAVLTTEERMGRAVLRIMYGVEEALPGRRRPVQGWELDLERGLRPLGSDAEE